MLPERSKNPSTPANFDHLEVLSTPGKGRAVVSKKGFVKGAEVLQFFGSKRHVSEFDDLTHALQIGPSTYLEPSGLLDDFVNHSCDPNTGIRQDDEGRVILFALRPIRKGEEITFDYATTQSGGHSSMPCLCGASNCRGIIKDFSDLSDNQKSFYCSQGAVLGYLLEAPSN